MKLQHFSDVPNSRRKLLVVALIACAAVLTITSIMLALHGPPAPLAGLCGACHEMAPSVAAWRQSPHARVGCYSCHESPGPWYLGPQRLLSRTSMLVRDASWHLSGRRSDAASTAAVAVVTKDTCRRCHDPSRLPTSRDRVIIDHREHARRNDSCLSCHQNTAHPDQLGDSPLSMMSLCFECHGMSRTAAAPGRCGLCHPPGFDLQPETHETRTWSRLHGKRALSDRRACSMCHKARFCGDCHGIEMPHPRGWVGEDSTHGITATRDRRVCAKCHGEKSDSCSSCHHGSIDLHKGPWIQQHYAVVGQSGPLPCMKCHPGLLYCNRCHTTGRAP